MRKVSKNMMIGIIAAIVVVLVIVVMMTRKKKTSKEECPIDADLLIKALGGKDNITALEASPSKLKATLKQDKDLDIETIKTLGASGIVAGHLTLTMIFGKASSVICETVLEKIK